MIRSAIDRLFCTVYIGNEISVSQPFFLNQIYLTAKQPFKRVAETEIIADIVKLLMINRLKVNKQVDIALFIESISQNRAENRERLDLMQFAEVKYAL